MGIFDQYYLNEYKRIMKKINKLNERNVEGYNTFARYVYSNEIMIEYFKKLKKIEKKYKSLTVDSFETFENNLALQLNQIYNNKISKIFQNSNVEERIQELKKLQQDMQNGLGHKCDSIINKLLIDLNNKILENNKYKIKSTNEKLNLEDSLLTDVLIYGIGQKKLSASMIQRKFRINYERALRILDVLEEYGFISKSNGTNPRDVLINSIDDVVIKRNTVVKMSNEEIREQELLEERESKSLNEIMQEYDIDIKYENDSYCENIKNTLIIETDSIFEKTDLINTLIKYNHPNSMKLILFNLNQITYNQYFGLPHLLIPIVSDDNKVNSVFEYLYIEMTKRLELLVKNKVKTFEKYQKINSELPYLIIVIDEIYDILNSKNIDDNLLKLLLNGNQVGIKFILFSKFSKKNLSLGMIEDLFNVYNKYDIDKIICTTTSNSLDIDLNKIDNELNGFQFEKYASDLLYANGFDRVSVTQFSGDFGTDIIAYKDDIKYAIQCKRYSSPVGIKAVQEVIGSKTMNNCHVAVVLTNNYFTPSAKELALKNSVLLWDRDKLEELMKKI